MRFLLSITILVVILAYFQVMAEEEEQPELLRVKRQFGGGFGRGFGGGFGHGGFNRGGFGGHHGGFGGPGFGGGHHHHGGFGNGFYG